MVRSDLSLVWVLMFGGVALAVEVIWGFCTRASMLLILPDAAPLSYGIIALRILLLLSGAALTFYASRELDAMQRQASLAIGSSHVVLLIAAVFLIVAAFPVSR